MNKKTPWENLHWNTEKTASTWEMYFSFPKSKIHACSNCISTDPWSSFFFLKKKRELVRGPFLHHKYNFVSIIYKPSACCLHIVATCGTTPSWECGVRTEKKRFLWVHGEICWEGNLYVAAWFAASGHGAGWLVCLFVPFGVGTCCVRRINGSIKGKGCKDDRWKIAPPW